MSVRESSAESNRGHLPNQISSSSSLDSFLINLPTTADSPPDFMNVDECTANDTEADYEAAISSSIDDDKSKDQSSRGYGFIRDKTEGSQIPSKQATDHPLTRPLYGRRVSAPAAVSSADVTNSSVPEFLYQLTKMLTDDNSDVIEWSSGRIEVHSPQKLESHVLKKYFRHSKFASFQRQLNYFGFRKLAGKGKMAPCSYVNDTAMEDINSLFHIKRKSGGDPPNNPSKKSRDYGMKAMRRETIPQVNPVLAGIYNRTSLKPIQSSETTRPVVSAAGSEPPVANAEVVTSGGLPGSTQQELARKAVGKGIRHDFGRPPVVVVAEQRPETIPVKPSPAVAPATNLNELTSNYHNTLLSNHTNVFDNDDDPTPLSQMQDRTGPFFEVFCGGFLSRNSSLIDLAMIAPVEDNEDNDQALSSATDGELIDFFSSAEGNFSENQI